MVRKFTLIYCMIVLMIQSSAYAGVKEDYEQARKIYIAAEACMAAYSDRYGHLANVSLERNGWLTNRYEKTGKNVDARFLLLKKQTQKGKQVFILAIVGTENAKDIRSNLKVEKAFFAGTKLDEFAANAEKTRVSNTEPKVHRGFHNFVQALLTTKTRDNTGNLVYLTDILLASSEQKIYIVGHSRGGAAATLVAARMISMGIKPEQIEVITFGAPAVGNDAFAAEFAPVMNLTRVVMSGDPFTGILQKLVRGYKQFGRKILWESQGEQSHELTEYTDRAIKMYYDTRRDALRAGVVQFPPKTGSCSQ